MNTPEFPSKTQKLVIPCLCRGITEGRTKNRITAQRLRRPFPVTDRLSRFCPKERQKYDF